MIKPPFAAAFLFAGLLAAPVLAEPPNAPASVPAKAGAEVPGEANQPITFDHYRDWRLAYLERRRSELTVQLAAADLPAPRKSRLEQTKAYYDWLAGLSDTERDRRFRERFDRIDANHDGQIDPAERAAWREKQRAFYHRESGSPTQASNAR